MRCLLTFFLLFFSNPIWRFTTKILRCNIILEQFDYEYIRTTLKYKICDSFGTILDSWFHENMKHVQISCNHQCGIKYVSFAHEHTLEYTEIYNEDTHDDPTIRKDSRMYKKFKSLLSYLQQFQGCMKKEVRIAAYSPTIPHNYLLLVLSILHAQSEQTHAYTPCIIGLHCMIQACFYIRKFSCISVVLYA